MFVVGQDVYARSTKSNDKNVEHNDKEHDAHDDGIEATANLKPKKKSIFLNSLRSTYQNFLITRSIQLEYGRLFLLKSIHFLNSFAQRSCFHKLKSMPTLFAK